MLDLTRMDKSDVESMVKAAKTVQWNETYSKRGKEAGHEKSSVEAGGHRQAARSM
ncbi:MAG: hypothetical protein IPP74_11940 [Alphaproteobacteria bacterium]|nr:hypothetical protein [Alphaproteobacteria bacterium]